MPARRVRPHGIKVFAKLSSESGWKAVRKNKEEETWERFIRWT